MKHKPKKNCTENIPINYYIKEYLSSCEDRGLSQNSVLMYKHALNRFIEYTHVEYISDINHRCINGCIGKMRSQRLSMSSIRYFMTIYKCFAAWLNKQDYTNIRLALIESVRHTTHKRIILSDREVKNIVNSFDASTIEGLRDRAIVSFLATSGLRVSELCSLNREDMPTEVLKKKVARITVRGKGGKNETIFLTPHTYRYIQEYLDCRTEDNRALFVSKNTKTMEWNRMSRTAIYNMVKKAGIRADVRYPISPHTLRHYTATKYLRHNQNLYAVKEIMRHKSIVTTQIYLHYGQQDIEDIVAKVMNEKE